MAITFGKLETQITVPTGGWTATISGNTATIAAGTYYMSSVGNQAADFLATVQTAFDTAGDISGATVCTVTASHSENGTGICTIAFTVAKSITWVSTDLRDILGFTGNLGSGTSHVATQSCRGIWLPTCPFNQLNSGSSWQGWLESDYRGAENAAGYVFNLMGQYKTVNALEWPAITQAKTWNASETTENQSFEQFLLDGIWGTAAWGTPGGPVRFYPDAATDGTYVTYKIPDIKEFKPERFASDLTTMYRISLPRLVKVPS